MSLNLQSNSTLPQVFTGGFSVDNLSWWFWIKAGIGLSLGAGLVTVVATVLWAYIVTQMPSLWLARQFLR